MDSPHFNIHIAYSYMLRLTIRARGGVLGFRWCHAKKHYVYWGFGASLLRFSSESAIFAFGNAKEPLQNQKLGNVFHQKNLVTRGVWVCFEKAPPQKKTRSSEFCFCHFLTPDWGDRTFWAKIPTPRWAPPSRNKGYVTFKFKKPLFSDGFVR